MRFIKPVSCIVVGLLITVLLGYVVCLPKAAHGDSVQFSGNDPAPSSYYYGTASTDNANAGSSIVSVNVVSMASTIGTPAACAQRSAIDLFAKGTDGALWWEHWDGQVWGTWKSLGGVLTSDPAATSSATGHIDVFVRGSDGLLWVKNTTNGGTSWSNWHKIGGQLASGTGPAVCAPTANSLSVFVKGTDHALWYTSSQWLEWSAWTSVGGQLTLSPAAISGSASTIDVFVCGSDGGLWQKSYYSSAWGPWRAVGGGIDTGLTQGIANDGIYNYGISTTALYKYDAAWNQIGANTNAGTQLGVNHLADGCCYNGMIYVAACNYTPGSSCADKEWNNSRIGIFNASDLRYVGYADISAQKFDAGGCGVDVTDGYLWVCSYCNGTCYKYNLSNFSFVGSMIPSPSLPNMQGIEPYGGYLFVSVLNTGIIRMNINGTEQTTAIPYSKLNTGEIEGLDVKSDYIRVLCGNEVFTFVNSYTA